MKITRIATLAALLTAVVAAPAAAAGPVDDDSAEGVAAATYRESFPQMTQAAADKAAVEQEARHSLLAPLREDGGLTFGGAWFDPPSGVFHIAATTPAAVTRAAELGREKNLNVQTHLVTRSFEQLERQARALRNGAGVLGAAANGHVGIDVKTNQVVVAVPSDQLQSLRAARAAGVKLIADPNLEVELDQCAGRDVCDGSLAAGAMIFGGVGCSIGFTAEDPVTLARVVLTAGHCSTGIGINWFTGAQQIGPITSALDSGDIDAGVIEVTNALYTGQPGGRLYNTADVDAVVDDLSEILIGDPVCKAANFQDPTGPRYCGVIGSQSDANVNGLVRVDNEDSCSGDSGGSWYRLIDGVTPKLRIAYGLHSRSHSGCRGSSGGTQSWFSALPVVKAGFAPAADYNVETR